MYYKRQKVFSIIKILDQLTEYLRENRKMPSAIYLPPEEKVYLCYLMDSLNEGQNIFCGIPLSVYYDKQELPFAY